MCIRQKSVRPLEFSGGLSLRATLLSASGGVHAGLTRHRGKEGRCASTFSKAFVPGRHPLLEPAASLIFGNYRFHGCLMSVKLCPREGVLGCRQNTLLSELYLEAVSHPFSPRAEELLVLCIFKESIAVLWPLIYSDS